MEWTFPSVIRKKFAEEIKQKVPDLILSDTKKVPDQTAPKSSFMCDYFVFSEYFGPSTQR